MSKIEVDAIEPQSGTSLTLGASGDTITIPSGATLTNSGTATGFGTAFADANYCAVGMAGSTSGGESGTMIVVSTKKNTSQATGNVRVSTMYTDSDNTDVSNIGVAIFR
jgi:hypothetical protein